MSLLELSDIETNYGAVRALRGISLKVEEGAMIALLGANGAGKSTTLKSISGMVKPAQGQILLDGKSIIGLTPNQIVRQGIAQVPEGRKVFKNLTVRENLAMGAYARSDHKGITDDLSLIFTLFPRLKEREAQLGGSLSGGEQQMLAIGRGLMARPRLLLLDEPSLGLAPIVIADIFATLLRVNRERKMTMLIVEQNANIAMKSTSYAYVLQVGKIVIEGTSVELRSKGKLLESYMGGG
ncbi:MAG TPA: ABC transporter ATP-binding protein [Hyphomicrobiaceae bacterium]|nr:ABC transporter ATP-binding protein [Hyphomicrobiaceae bacterium]